MRKYLLAFLWSLSGVALSDTALVVHVFSKNLSIPKDCQLFASPSIIDNEIKIYCTDMFINFRKAQECEGAMNSEHGKTLDEFTFGNLFVATREIKPLPRSPSQRIKMVWDTEVCLTLMGQSEKKKEDFLAPLWN